MAPKLGKAYALIKLIVLTYQSPLKKILMLPNMQLDKWKHEKENVESFPSAALS